VSKICFNSISILMINAQKRVSVKYIINYFECHRLFVFGLANNSENYLENHDKIKCVLL